MMANSHSQPAVFALTVGATSQFTVTINAAQTTNTDAACWISRRCARSRFCGA